MRGFEDDAVLGHQIVVDTVQQADQTVTRLDAGRSAGGHGTQFDRAFRTDKDITRRSTRDPIADSDVEVVAQLHLNPRKIHNLTQVDRNLCLGTKGFSEFNPGSIRGDGRDVIGRVRGVDVGRRALAVGRNADGGSREVGQNDGIAHCKASELRTTVIADAFQVRLFNGHHGADIIAHRIQRDRRKVDGDVKIKAGDFAAIGGERHLVCAGRQNREELLFGRIGGVALDLQNVTRFEDRVKGGPRGSRAPNNLVAGDLEIDGRSDALGGEEVDIAPLGGRQQQTIFPRQGLIKVNQHLTCGHAHIALGVEGESACNNVGVFDGRVGIGDRLQKPRTHAIDQFVRRPDLDRRLDRRRFRRRQRHHISAVASGNGARCHGRGTRTGRNTAFGILCANLGLSEGQRPGAISQNDGAFGHAVPDNGHGRVFCACASQRGIGAVGKLRGQRQELLRARVDQGADRQIGSGGRCVQRRCLCPNKAGGRIGRRQSIFGVRLQQADGIGGSQQQLVRAVIIHDRVKVKQRGEVCVQFAACGRV